jgi:hypothetical protein
MSTVSRTAENKRMSSKYFQKFHEMYGCSQCFPLIAGDVSLYISGGLHFPNQDKNTYGITAVLDTRVAKEQIQNSMNKN